MRYQGWSGRVTAEAYTHTFAQLPVEMWRLMNIAQYAVLVLCLYKYYTLLVARRSKEQDSLVLALCAVVPFAMGVATLLGAAFWISGSFNYLWVVALGLVAFYPVLYVYMKRTLPQAWLMAAGILAAMLACLGQEQVFVLLAGFTGLVAVALFWQTRRIWWYPSVQLAVTIAAAAVSYFAPGNKIRLEAEVATWLPTFHTASLLNRIEWSLRWFMDSVINQFGFVLVLMWILIVLLLLAGARRYALNLRDKVVISTLAVAVFLHLDSPIREYLFNFHALWGVQDFPVMSYPVLLLWLVVLAAMLAGLYRVSEMYLRRRFTLPLIGLGALVATAIVTLSPTMYASEQRTLFVPGVLAILIVVVLAVCVLREHKTRRYLLLTGLLLACAINFAALLAHRSQFLQTLVG